MEGEGHPGWGWVTVSGEPGQVRGARAVESAATGPGSWGVVAAWVVCAWILLERVDSSGVGVVLSGEWMWA
ncbi:hypothetical protein HEK616_41360 [Streptomyces nigrescens]|uniref:Uncharacterized protein n=1 Tax=Streptomyces nigrescens TaxID=1920 RepID=A0ABN6QWT0_STRNI|nr:hypothetical protein HEK616_41360 [Streptomyces nigrescens]